MDECTTNDKTIRAVSDWAAQVDEDNPETIAKVAELFANRDGAPWLLPLAADLWRQQPGTLSQACGMIPSDTVLWESPLNDPAPADWVEIILRVETLEPGATPDDARALFAGIAASESDAARGAAFLADGTDEESFPRLWWTQALDDDLIQEARMIARGGPRGITWFEWNGAWFLIHDSTDHDETQAPDQP